MKFKFEDIEIPDNKLSGYLLNRNHSVGGHKARYFESLGFDIHNSGLLKDALIKHLNDATEIDSSENQYGTKIIVKGEILGLNGNYSKIKSVWFIENKENILKFVTAYPNKNDKRTR